MTGPDQTGSGSDMPDAAGMPPLDPPRAWPDDDPEVPDPADLVPGRPGTPATGDDGTGAS